MKKILMIVTVTVSMISCGHHTYVVNNQGGGASGINVTQVDNRVVVKEIPETKPNKGRKMAWIVPNATAFRMSGDYAGNVAVTLNDNGDLLYFPDPSDITADSAPVDLGEGWWLNNQGLGPNSVFTKYTFAEYASLPEVPSANQLKQAIIPGAKVTEFIELPMKAGEATKNLEEIRIYIKNL